MCLVYHFLIEVRLEKLNLLTVVQNSSLDNSPSLFNRAAAHATADIGCHFMAQLHQIVVTRHKVDVLTAVVLVNKVDYLFEVVGVAADGLDVDVHYAMAGEFFENILKLNNFKTFKSLTFFDSEVVLQKFFIGLFGHLAHAVRNPFKGRIVQ
jgi:hypothetical protein